MLRFVKGTLRRLSTIRDAQAPKRIAELRCRDIWLTGSLQGEYQANQLLFGVREGDIVMLTFSPFLGEIGGESVVPKADISGGVIESVSKIAGTAFFHVSVSVNQFAGLVGGR